MDNSHESAPLLRTKLRRPVIRPELIARPRLQQQVTSGLNLALTLIIAPAGFGKTTLAASSLAQNPAKTAWLSLDKNDNQPGFFLRYLVASLQTINPIIGAEAEQYLESVQQKLPEAILASLVNDVENQPEEIILALDDYHLITNQFIHDALAFLLEHQPRNLHLVVATRSDPPLPIARLRASGQLVELRAVDLRFTQTEVLEFLNNVMGLQLDEKSAEVLEERTEGWIAGLQMAALSLRDRKDVFSFIEGFSGTNRYIMDYLLEQVMSGQPNEVQQFLLYTSILDRLCAPLCDTLLSYIQSQQPIPNRQFESSFAIIQYLEKKNLFLISLDEERQWFRYHHLFIDLLRSRLQQSQADLIPDLHIKAAEWLQQNNFIPEAIEHCLIAADFNHAANLIEFYGPKYWMENDPSIMQMADNLPGELLISRPRLGIYRAWLYVIQGNILKAMPLLNALAVKLKDATAGSEEHWIRMIINVAFAFLERPADSKQRIPLPEPDDLDDIPANEVILRDAARILYGMTLGRRGENELAAEVSLRFIKQEKSPHKRLTVPTLVSFLARIYLMLGKLHETMALCHEYLDPIQTGGYRFIYSAGSLYISLGEALFELNRLQEAEEYIRKGMEENEPWVDVMTNAFGLIALTRVLCAINNFEEAMQTMEEFEEKMQRDSRPTEFQEDFRTLRVYVQLAAGKLDEVSDWADHLRQNRDFEEHTEYYELILAHVYLVQHRFADVEELLAGKSVRSESANLLRRQIDYHLLVAAAQAGLGRPEAALEHIVSSLELAEPQGYIRVFLDAGEPIRNLLAAYLRSGEPVQAAYARKVLEAFLAEGETANSSQGGLIEPLSARELEVLELMSLGKTNQEIARDLVVASGTIKAHAASIYRKLDAANRTEAVTHARELGILK